MKIQFATEKELEDFIFERWQSTGKMIVNDSRPDHLLRQVNFGPHGIADLIGFKLNFHEGEPWIHVDIFELKNGPITAAAFQQIHRYRLGVLAAFPFPQKVDFRVFLNLVGTSIDDSQTMLCTGHTFYYQLDFDPLEGVVFDDTHGMGEWDRLDNEPSKLIMDVREKLTSRALAAKNVVALKKV